MTTQTDIGDMAVQLLYQPVAGVILRICLLEADSANRSREAIRESAKRTWAQHGFPVLSDEEFDQALDFLLDHRLVMYVGVLSLTYSITGHGKAVGEKLWAAYLAFLRAS